MAVIKGSFYSESLFEITHYTALLPDKAFEQVGVLYLLHGRSGNAESWLNQTGILRYLKDLPLVVFCPEVSLSYYQNMTLGGNYWDFITREFPAKMEQFHRYSVTQEFVAGNSMGGYGALTWLLAEPKRFAAGGLFSPLINPEQLLETFPEAEKELLAAFGEIAISHSDKNLSNCSTFHDLPMIYHSCGTADFLYEESEILRRNMSQNNNYTFDISHGKHDWDEWDRGIYRFIQQISKGL